MATRDLAELRLKRRREVAGKLKVYGIQPSFDAVDNSFRTTFYFNDRAEQAISESAISDELKEQYSNARRFNTIRGLTIVFKHKRDIKYAKALIAIKLSVK